MLLLERRVLQYRLVLTCERGLIELDVSHLPELVIETARVPLRSGFGVVGRIEGGGFAVTAGKLEPWGLTGMRPATLVGSPTESLLDLPQALRELQGHRLLRAKLLSSQPGLPTRRYGAPAVPAK